MEIDCIKQPRRENTYVGLCAIHAVVFAGVNLPFTRLPGYRSITRNDIFVFNVPWEVKPISQKTNYIKRAVGIPGDTLEFKDKVLFVNGEAEPTHDGIQKFHTLVLKQGVRLTNAKMEEINAGTIGASSRYFQQVSNLEYRVNLTYDAVKKVFLGLKPILFTQLLFQLIR